MSGSVLCVLLRRRRVYRQYQPFSLGGVGAGVRDRARDVQR